MHETKAYLRHSSIKKLFAKLQNSSPFKPAQPKVTLKFGPGGPKGSTPVPATAPALEQQDNHDQNLANGSYSVPSTVPGGDAPADAPWPSLASTGGVALPQRRTKKHAQIFLPPKRPASLSRHSSFDLVTAGPARSSLSRGASSKSDYAPTSQSGSGPLPPPVAQRVPKVLSGLGVGTSSCEEPVFFFRVMSFARADQDVLQTSAPCVPHPNLPATILGVLIHSHILEWVLKATLHYSPSRDRSARHRCQQLRGAYTVQLTTKMDDPSTCSRYVLVARGQERQWRNLIVVDCPWWGHGAGNIHPTPSTCIWRSPQTKGISTSQTRRDAHPRREGQSIARWATRVV